MFFHSVLSPQSSVLLLIPATMLPLVAFLVIFVFTRRRPRLSAGLSIGSVAVSLACSLVLLGLNLKMTGPIQYSVRLLASSGLDIPFGFLLDQLNLLMIVVVSAICFLVQVYSLGYMAGDPGFSRYYSFMSLFAWAMMNLTLSPTLLQLYVFWELVGLSSYLLIGFWYEKFSATQAGKKAFVMTRLGDAAFFIGFLLVFLHTGNLSIQDLNGRAVSAAFPPSVLTLSALLIFGGIVGKSAQFPLLTWLPDAMEGPTPVSALLHSATMVAAGVYLFARLFPFFSMSPAAMGVFLAIGTISMFLASTMAIVSRDIKQVWAYSTISQLGFMIMALAAGGYFAGVFHLTAHAGFKSLLFLCSGVFIHRYGTNDVYELGRLGSRRTIVPTVTIILAAAALSGFWPLSGYYSKEAVMASLAALPNPAWLVAGLAGVFLTAYYSFRLIFILVLPRAVGPPAGLPAASGGGPNSQDPHGGAEAGHETHYWVMAWPLLVLTAITVILGFLRNPLKDFLQAGIMAATPIPAAEGGPFAWFHLAAPGLAVAGAVLAWVEFGRSGAKQIGFVERVPPLFRLFAERWYIDHFYRLLVNLVDDRGISYLCYQNDKKVIDGSIDELGEGTIEGGRIVAFLQSGMIQYRLLVIFAVMVLLSIYFFFQVI
ncbi:MAG TPA: NADH-quinone oxidoreductase subunit L [Deltaproteobacteria bacterium]|nr:NADH-quinone oxidoreductase subunit L [Deltaproteobacteria bacterium]